MEQKVKLEGLSADEKKALLDQLMADKKAKDAAIKQERALYKQMVNEAVMGCYSMLLSASEQLSHAKEFVFATLGCLVKMKAELYNKEDGQYSHTFTNEDGTVSITIGRNVNDGWDDTATTGEAMVREYIDGMGKDADSKFLVKTVNKFLGKDKHKRLKMGNIFTLEKLADERGDKKLIDAVKVIRDAYRPVLSGEYIRCTHKDGKENKVNLPLDITSAPVGVKEPDSDESQNQEP